MKASARKKIRALTEAEKRRRRLRRAWITAAASVASLVLAGVLPIWLVPTPHAHSEGTRGRELPPGYQLLLGTLDRRDRCWLPAERDELLAQLGQMASELTPPAIWVLQQPRHRRFTAVAALCADLRLAAALPALREVAERGPEAARAAALVAADLLEPLTEDELVRCLQDEAAAVQLAGLQVLGRREAPSTEAVVAAVRLLDDADAAVRQAALAALPETLPDAAAAPLVRLLGDRVAFPLAMRALTRLQATPENAAVLAERLQQAEPDLQRAVLQDIDRFAHHESVQWLLWELARTPGPSRLRAAALHCLCRIGADGSRLALGDVAVWEPDLRFLAARLLVASGQRPGIDLLLQLAEDRSPEASGARAQALALLGRLANLPPHTDPRVFHQWSRDLASVPPVTLPALPPR